MCLFPHEILASDTGQLFYLLWPFLRRDPRGGATRAGGALDLVITNALIIDHWGIVKADIGVREGRIVKIGKAVLYPIGELDAWDQKNTAPCRASKRLSVGAGDDQ